jgi:MATE family multidrug resistance protein
VDTWAIGHLPDPRFLAAIAVGSTIFTFIYWGFGFLRMGTTGHVAQAHGRKDLGEVAALIFRSSIMALLIAAFLLVLQTLILKVGIFALSPPEGVKTPLSDYFDIRIWSAPASLLLFTLNGYLIGTARAKAALLLQLFLNIANAALNLIFVIGLNMGVEGVALGTVVAEYGALTLGFFIMNRQISFKLFAKQAVLKINRQWAAYAPLISTNLFLFLRTLLLLTTFSMVTRDAGQLGATELAASQIISVFIMLISLGLDGFAYAAEALAGAAYGAKNKSSFSLWVRIGFFWAVITSLFYSVCFWLFGSEIISALTDIEAIQLSANRALFAVILLPITALWCYQYDGVFIGATSSKAMMVTMAAAFIVFIAVKNPMTDAYGLLGLWLTINIFMIARGIGLALYYPSLLRHFRPVAA